MTDIVSYTSSNRIALITINRAERLNALNEEVIVSLQAAWQKFEHSEDRVAVLHAAGDRAWSVGADVKDPPKEMWQGYPALAFKSLNQLLLQCTAGVLVALTALCKCVIWWWPPKIQNLSTQKPSLVLLVV